MAEASGERFSTPHTLGGYRGSSDTQQRVWQPSKEVLTDLLGKASPVHSPARAHTLLLLPLFTLWVTLTSALHSLHHCVAMTTGPGPRLSGKVV